MEAAKPKQQTFPPPVVAYKAAIEAATSADDVGKALEKAATNDDVNAKDLQVLERAAQDRIAQLATLAAPAEKGLGKSFTVRDLSAELDIPPGFVLEMNGKPYVTKEGLLLQARRIGYASIEAEIRPIDGDPEKGWEAEGKVFRLLTREEMDLLGKAFASDKDAGLQAYRDLRRPTTAHATATKQNVQMSTLHNRLRELAETRAINRALRLYTGCGLATVEELPETGNA
jgi:hypothetical protein